MDLFATRFNHKLHRFVSPVPDPAAWDVDALSITWGNLDVYTFPPVSLLNQVVSKVMDQGCLRMVLIDPGWPNIPWFWDLVNLSVQIQSLPAPTPQGARDSASQWPSSQEPSQLKSTCVAPRASCIQEQGFADEVAARIEAPQRSSTRAVYKSKWTIFMSSLCGVGVHIRVNNFFSKTTRLRDMLFFLKDTLSIEDEKIVQGMQICLFVCLLETLQGRYPHQKCENFNTLSQFSQ